MTRPPPRPPWLAVVLLLVVIGAVIAALVTMWPGMRKVHPIQKASFQFAPWATGAAGDPTTEVAAVRRSSPSGIADA